MAEPNNLNIDSLLSKDDMNKLVELLGQNSVSLGGGNSKKKNKMTPQAKNLLLNQLSSHQKIQEVQKPFKDMNEEEKKIYRDELKSRLHNKQNIFKQNRTNHNVLQKSLDAKLKKSTDAKNKTDSIGPDVEMGETHEMGEVEVTDSTHSTDPVDPVDPAKSVDPVDPAKPVEPVEPVEPVSSTTEAQENLEDFVN
jgi:hypothetical protein